MESREEQKCHPLLNGKKRNGTYSHGFSFYEIQSLSSICETFIPCVPVEKVDAVGHDKPRKSLQDFYLASGSDDPVPDEVAALIVKRTVPLARILIRLILLTLATRLGTLILCGSASFCCKYPFIRNFSEIPVDKREEVLHKWSRTRFLIPLKQAFVIFKIFSLFTFFSLVDENSKNLSLEAIGYQARLDQKIPQVENQKSLRRGIIETDNLSESSLFQSFKEKGLTVTKDPTQELYSLECDVVIVGSGCGGGVAAGVLAKSGRKVVVLEKGNYFSAEDFSSLEGPSLDQMYESGGMLSTIDGSFILLAGSTVGGGSTINWAASLKTPKAVLNEWAESLQLSIFTSSSYKSAMDVVYKILQITDQCDQQGFQNQVLIKGCKNLSLEVEAIPKNASAGHYCGSCGYGCKTGDKKGTSNTWLVDAVDNGAVILTGIKAERFIIEKNEGGVQKKKKCLGVVARTMSKNVKRFQIRAKVSISACGALLTPPLLISSGLKNKNIGKKLHLHPALMVWGYFPDTVGDLKGKMYEGGIMTTIHKVITDFSNSQVVIETPALGPGSFAAMFPWISGKDHKERMVKYGRTAHLFCLLRDKGHGEVLGEGRIRYKPNESDIENMREGLKCALRILIAAGAVEVGTYRSDGYRLNCEGIKEKDIERFLSGVTVEGGPSTARELWNILSSAHQMSTCRMSVNEKEGVVDENGECWEVEDLFVCDASIIPTSIGVNPMVTIQSISYCISNKIAECFKKK